VVADWRWLLVYGRAKASQLEALDVSYNKGLDTRLYIYLRNLRSVHLAGLGLQQLEASIASMKHLTMVDLQRYD
jgi:Leucine-rich repeat (LRR) protein